MNKEELKSILKLAIGVTLIVLAIKFFVFLLPFILLIILGYYAYAFYKKTKFQTEQKMNTEKDKKKTSRKKTSVQEAEIVREKNND